MFCEECGSKLKKDDLFCDNCGHKVKLEKEKNIFCESCGNKMKSNDIFCEKCGAKTNKKLTSTANKKIPIIIASIFAVLIIGSIVLTLVLNNPSRAIKEFCSAIEKADYKTVYKMLDLPKSDYLTIEIFEEYAKNEKDIKKCTINKEKSNKEKNIYNIEIDYENKEKEIIDVKINKMDKKKYLLFDDYKVIPDMFVIKEWTISVPVGSKVYVNGKEQKNKEVSIYSITDKYKVKNLFNYEYTVKVTKPLMQDHVEKYFPTGNAYISLKTDPKALEALKEFLTTFYEVALADEDYNLLKDYIDPSYSNKINKSLEDIKEDISKDTSIFEIEGFKDIKIGSLYIPKAEILDNGNIKLRANFYLSYKYKLKPESYITDLERSGNLSKYLDLEFKVKNDKWKLVNKY